MVWGVVYKVGEMREGRDFSTCRCVPESRSGVGMIHRELSRLLLSRAGAVLNVAAGAF